jgi:anti-anti-sigma factor
VDIERTQIGDKVVLHVAGRMDAESAVHFEDQCESCMSDGFTSIVADLGNLKYVSSMGLGAIVRMARKLQDKGGELRQLFEITKLNRVFPAHDSVESALMKS